MRIILSVGRQAGSGRNDDDGDVDDEMRAQRARRQFGERSARKQWHIALV